MSVSRQYTHQHRGDALHRVCLLWLRVLSYRLSKRCRLERLPAGTTHKCNCVCLAWFETIQCHQPVGFAHLCSTIRGWAPPTFQVSGDPLADRRHQRVELFGRGDIDPMKSQFSIALGRKDAINEQRMKMQVQIQS